MSMMPDINANLNPTFDFTDSCNCCLPRWHKRNKEVKISETAQEVLKTDKNPETQKTR